VQLYLIFKIITSAK